MQWNGNQFYRFTCINDIIYINIGNDNILFNYVCRGSDIIYNINENILFYTIIRDLASKPPMCKL